jgi:outer membrane protein W
VSASSEPSSAGTKAYELKVNPFVLGAGLGYRF